MTRSSMRLKLNGVERAVDASPDTPLLDVLREDCALHGTRPGCRAGACGACHVLLDGRSVPACDTPLWSALGREVRTVEGLDDAIGQALREAFLAEQAAQCGWCSAGMLVAAAALLRERPQPSEAEVRAALDRHLCRCGAHLRILRAVQRAAAALAAGRPAAAKREGPPSE